MCQKDTHKRSTRQNMTSCHVQNFALRYDMRKRQMHLCQTEEAKAHAQKATAAPEGTAPSLRRSKRQSPFRKSSKQGQTNKRTPHLRPCVTSTLRRGFPPHARKGKCICDMSGKAKCQSNLKPRSLMRGWVARKPRWGHGRKRKRMRKRQMHLRHVGTRHAKRL